MAKAMAQRPKGKTKSKAGKTPPWGRLAVATLLGYIASVAASSALTSLLPVSRAESTFMSLLIVGLVYPALFIWVFARRAWWQGLRDLAVLSAGSCMVLSVTRWGLF
ncbi:MAG: hypothetical protein AAGH87_04480 [Pseudomonadota bacterium]